MIWLQSGSDIERKPNIKSPYKDEENIHNKKKKKPNKIKQNIGEQQKTKEKNKMKTEWENYKSKNNQSNKKINNKGSEAKS